MYFIHGLGYTNTERRVKWQDVHVTRIHKQPGTENRDDIYV